MIECRAGIALDIETPAFSVERTTRLRPVIAAAEGQSRGESEGVFRPSRRGSREPSRAAWHQNCAVDDRAKRKNDLLSSSYTIRILDRDTR